MMLRYDGGKHVYGLLASNGLQGFRTYWNRVGKIPTFIVPNSFQTKKNYCHQN